VGFEVPRNNTLQKEAIALSKAVSRTVTLWEPINSLGRSHGKKVPMGDV